LGKRFMPPYLYRHQITRQPDISRKKLHSVFASSNLDLVGVGSLPMFSAIPDRHLSE
jgi:hypothetical protein